VTPLYLPKCLERLSEKSLKGFLSVCWWNLRPSNGAAGPVLTTRGSPQWSLSGPFRHFTEGFSVVRSPFAIKVSKNTQYR